MKINGGCYCGYLTYEAEIDPQTVSLCHCTDCQTFSGSAFRSNVPARKEGFRLLTGQPKVFVKTAASGNKRAQAFCPECGTHIYATSPTDPQVYGIRTMTSRQRAELPPQKQIWCQSAQPWVMGLNAIAQTPRQPG